MKKLFSVILASALAVVFCASAFAAGMGDVVGDDNLVTAADARAILRAAVELEPLAPDREKLGDMDLDGIITAYDARLALRVAVGLEKVDGKPYGNQLEVIASGHFYAELTVTAASETVDMIVASTENSFYVNTVLEDLKISLLTNDDGQYLLDSDEAVYASMDELLEEMDMDIDAMIREEMDILSYLNDIDKAEKTEATFNGIACDCYTMTDKTDTVRIYRDKTQLLAMTVTDKDGNEITSVVFNRISLAVPCECTAVPPSYTEKDLADFFMENLAIMA